MAFGGLWENVVILVVAAKTRRRKTTHKDHRLQITRKGYFICANADCVWTVDGSVFLLEYGLL